VPGVVDLAVIAAPAEWVVEVVWECAACVADVVVLSSGFAESGAEGRARPEGGWLDAQTAEALLGCYGIESAAAVVVECASSTTGGREARLPRRAEDRRP
jgi:hypothetical protein